MSDRAAVITDLGGGVHQVRLPLPWALDHVNCYAVEDEDGWTIFDTGLGTPGTGRRWREALEVLGRPHIRRVVVTHYHPDHNGNSGPLAELTGAEEIVQGRLDHELTYGAFLDPGGSARFEAYLLALGMPAVEAQTSATDERETPYRPATPTHLVDEGDAISLQGEEFRVFHLPGHADGHVVFCGESTGRMFGGDVILNEITPNVGLWEDASDADPLARYLESLVRIENEIAPSIVYPGHRTVITDAGARAREIRRHHDARLQTCEDALSTGAETAYEVGVHLWGGRLGYHERRFAMVEAAAHLVRLVGLGRAVSPEPYRWRPAPA
jgi:glyoxylase-like metal-dependent hydrolase (beta-lactamase superfamily II)